MSIVTLKVNRHNYTVDTEPDVPLLYVLRNDLELKSPKFGCGLGQCGACTVIVEGKAIRSCITQASAVQGFEITTLEGLGTLDKLHPIQKAFIDEQAVQCGYCYSGIILTAKAFLDQQPKATDAELRQALRGVLCRCSNHLSILHAIEKYAQEVGR
jgi:nicotinate dehydrogenase subunit A